MPSGGRSGLLRALMAAVRPQFRADVLVLPADDPVFGGGVCRVGGCSRSARGRGLCPGHLQRWVNQNRPDIDQFAASTDLRWRRQRPNQRCRVAGCGYGSTRGGLCQLHAQRWERAGRPDLDRWLVCPPAVKQPTPGASCLIAHCTLWPQAALPFCHSHANTWKVNGRPDIEEFARRFTELASTADETIRFDQLDAQLKLEMQYVLQARRDERRGKLTPGVVMRVVRLLADTPVTSMTDHDEHTWRQHGRSTLRDSRSRGFLSYAYRKVADLAEAGGWEAEYPRDVWQMRRSASRDPGPCGSTRSRSPGCGNWLNDGYGGGSPAGSGWKPPHGRFGSSPASPSSLPGRASSRSPRSTGRCWNAIWPTCTPRWPATSSGRAATSAC